MVAGALVAGTAAWISAGGVFEATAGGNGRTGAGGSAAQDGGVAGGAGGSALPTSVPPIGGTELYGFLPYWEMSAKMASYLERVPVSTLALFAVKATSSGAIKQNEIGYRRITGSIGRRLIADAHRRGQRIDLTFASFGYTGNDRLFGPGTAATGRHVTAAQQLANLAVELGVDGVNVDVEQLHASAVAGYGAFLIDLGLDLGRLVDSISVSTTANHEGATAAAAATRAGVHRVFLMGYDYHWSGSTAGATSPVHSRDTTHDLTTSITDYVQSGVPRDRILLGLPLYGMSWPVASPDAVAATIGRGKTFIPSSHVGQLLAPGFVPTPDDGEIAEWFVTSKAGTSPTLGPSPSSRPGSQPSSPPASPSRSQPSGTAAPVLAWTATYYDSPRTLRVKLQLARSQGLAGAGFWALGYERGLPGYVELMSDFRAGRVDP